MRPPSKDLVVDTNIFLSALFSDKARYGLKRAAGFRGLIYTAASADEIASVVARTEKFAGASADVINMLLHATQIEADIYSNLLEAAARQLRLAAASANGSTNDAHLLACAWVHEADIWSHDRDFAGSGWPSWSSANLLQALEQA